MTAQQPQDNQANGTQFKLRPWRELGVIGTMLMGLSWGVPWFRSLTQATNELSTTYAFFVFGSMMLAAYWFVRLLNVLGVRTDIRRMALLIVLFISIFIGLKTLLFADETVTLADLTDRQLESFGDAFALIPDEFIITIAVLLVWRRGTQLANEKVGPRLIRSAFGVGIAMYFAFIFLNTLVTGETFGNMPLLFIFAALMAMGASRVSVISTLRGGRDSPFDKRWMAGLLFSVTGVVGVAAWLGNEVSGGEGLLGTLPRMFLGLALAASFLVLTPVFMLLYWLLYSTVNVMEAENPVAERIGEFIGKLQAFAEGAFGFFEPFIGPMGEFLARFGIITKTLILWSVVLFLVVIIIFAVYIQDQRRRARLREQYEKITDEGLLDALRKALQNRADQTVRGIRDFFDLDRRRRLVAAARIRKIYMELMDLCASLHMPRADAATPFEFMVSICALFPDSKADVELITHAYERVRYGELPESRAEITSVEEAWNRLHASGEAKLKRKIGTAG